jgi:hypothetical protein
MGRAGQKGRRAEAKRPLGRQRLTWEDNIKRFLEM